MSRRPLGERGEAPIFVVGCSRSGTSMLRDLLRSHPRISIPPESHFIPLFYRAWGDPGSAGEARDLVGRILRLATIRRWELELTPGAFSSCRSFAAVIGRLHGEYAQREGSPRWGDKTPHHVAELPLLARLFPDARFLHIYRDGRDVARSWIGRPFGPANVYSAARTWEGLVRAGRRDGAELGDAYMEIRYETLLERPEPTMRSVCEFIGEPYTDAALQPAERTYRYAWRPMSQGIYRPRTRIESANHGRWRTEMQASERAIFESVAGELAAELGYPVEGFGRPIGPLGRARWSLDNAVRMSFDKRRFWEFSPRNSAVLFHAKLRARAGTAQHSISNR